MYALRTVWLTVVLLYSYDQVRMHICSQSASALTVYQVQYASTTGLVAVLLIVDRPQTRYFTRSGSGLGAYAQAMHTAVQIIT